MSWTGADVVGFALGLVVLPPLALVAIELAAGRLRPGWRWRLHLAFVGLLIGVFGMYLARSQAGAGDAVVAAAGVAVGAGGALAYRRLAAVRSMVSVLSVAPVAVVALFVLASPAGRLVLHDPPAAPAPAASATPVVLVVFDEFPTLSLMRRDGSLDAGAYPNLAALGRDGTWFRNATTAYDFSRVSVPAIVSGRRADAGTPPSLAAFPRNLFTLLPPSRAVRAYEQVTRLCPPARCPNNAPPPLPGRVTRVLPALARVSGATFLPQELLRRLPATHPLGKAPAPSQAERFARFERSIAADRRPGLFYLHASLPHGPWDRLPSGQSYPLTGCCSQDAFPGNPGLTGTGFAAFGPDRWSRKRFVVAQSRQRHLAQARFSDRLLGGVLRTLRASGRYDRALIVVSADHGIAFTPGQPARRLAPGNLDGVLGVPLFVKAPFQRRGRVSDAPARTTDITPTVTRALGLGNALGAAGVALTSQAVPPRASLPAYAVVDRRWRAFAFADFLRRRERSLATTAGLFGESGPFGSLYAFGPHRELIGRRARTLAMAARPRDSARIDEPWRWASVRPAASSIPAYVSGVLRGPRAGSEDLAIAVNGRLVATSLPYRSISGQVRFSAFLPPAALRRGPNSIRVYAIHSRGRALATLRPLGGRAA